MRKVIVSTYMSLDGVIENPMWTMDYWNDEIAAFQTKDLLSADALLLGRETYEGFAEAWSARSGDEFTDRMNSLPKHVASRTLQTAPTTWNATVIQGDAAEGIRQLKQQPGQNILKYGGGELLATLLQHNLLDELHVIVYPVVLGSGVRLFEDGSTAKFDLVETKPFSNGVLALVYKPA